MKYELRLEKSVTLAQAARSSAETRSRWTRTKCDVLEHIIRQAEKALKNIEKIENFVTWLNSICEKMSDFLM